MSIERWDILREIDEIHAEVDRIFNNFLRRIPNPMIEEKLTTWMPLVNIYDNADEIVIEIALPGVKKEDIDLSLQDRKLIVSGIRIGKSDKPHYLQEWRYGSFEREIDIPVPIKSDDIHAEYTDGILTVTMKKLNDI
ncbi:TPA: Hsp20/alpha crystallin family protein [Candidatus Poribacteria bacterium]|nr:Hsp20/alpha crystallin family protein [Candidatus Poribacteria bacterium]